MTSQLEAAEIIADELVDEPPVEARVELEEIAEGVEPVAATQAARASRAGQARHHKVKAGSLLAVRAATEYLYVAQDLRRIVIVAGALIATLLILWVLIVVAGVIPLPFY